MNAGPLALSGPTIPNEVEAERQLLGAILLDSDVLAMTSATLEPGHFYREGHQHLYRLLHRMWSEGLPIELAAVWSRVEAAGREDIVGGLSYVASLSDMVPSTHAAPHFAHLIQAAAVARQVLDAGRAITAAAMSKSYSSEELLAHATAMLADIQGTVQTAGWRHISDGVREAIDLAIRIDEEGEKQGIQTGYTDLDSLTGGLPRGELTVLGARPAMGKTALALNIARNVAAQGVGVGVFSLEMTMLQLSQRTASTETRMLARSPMEAVFASKLKRGGFRRSHDGRGYDDLEILARADESVRHLPLWVDDCGGLTRSRIRARAAQLKAQHPHLGLIVIDHLGLVRAERGDEGTRATYSATSWEAGKLLAKELDVAVLMLAQLNRTVANEGGSKVPHMHHLREAGQIEENAGLIGFLHRDAYYAGDLCPEHEKTVAEVHIRKNRHGATGVARLHFDADFVCFLDSDDHHSNRGAF